MNAKDARNSLDVYWSGDRGDAVDHRVRETNVVADPVRKLRIAQAGKRSERAASDTSIALYVVAGHDSEWA